MSYILDALKKSERARNLGRGVVLGKGERVSSVLTKRNTWPVAIGVTLLLGLSLMMGLYLRDTRFGNTDPESRPAVDTVAKDIGRTAQVEARQGTGLVKDSADNLAQQARKVSLTERRSKPSRIKSVTKTETPPTSATGTSSEPNQVPFLRTMPEDFQRSLPKLVVNIHVYSPDESQRMLYINNRQYHKGDQVGGGARVEEVVEDGVVMIHRGTRFKLQRPN